MKVKIHYRCPMCSMNLLPNEVNKHLHNHSVGDYMRLAYVKLQLVEVTDEGVRLLSEEENLKGRQVTDYNSPIFPQF